MFSLFIHHIALIQRENQASQRSDTKSVQKLLTCGTTEQMMVVLTTCMILLNAGLSSLWVFPTMLHV